MAELIVYRGQKQWTASDEVTASSLRRGWGNPTELELWTAHLLDGIFSSLNGAYRGVHDARSTLESLLLNAQLNAYLNPFVSCSHSQAVAMSFALAGDTPGYLLSIRTDLPLVSGTYLDFEEVRKRLGLFSDAVDYLDEFGIPHSIKPPYKLIRVERVELANRSTVWHA